MYLTHLHLRNFRNYRDLNLPLHPRLNVFVGDNAQGKTNIIEAVYFLSESRSFRSGTPADLVCWGSDVAYIDTVCVREDLQDQLTAEIQPTGKQLFRNGKKCRTMSEFTTVLFAPESLNLTKGGPAERREFLDHLMGQLYSQYRPTLRKYQQALIQHNRLLQNDEMPWEMMLRQMDGWKTQLMDYGAEVMVLRAQGICAINQHLSEAYSAIAGGGVNLQLRYQPRYGAEEANDSKEAVIGALAAAFRERAEDERRRRVTLVGPHRDDFAAHIGEKEVRHFASQGEHRSVVLALKRCEILLLQEAHCYPPILLLDDVASELDPDRNKSFFGHLLEMPGQVFISAVSADDVVLPQTQDASWFSVSDGRVQILQKSL